MPDPGVSEYRRPESVLVVVHDDLGQVLLLRRREPADFWQSVTGSLEWGEAPAAAARRELGEETGIQGRPEDSAQQRRFPIVPPWQDHYQPGTTLNLEHWFRIQVPVATPIRLNPAEHTAYAWMAAEAAAARTFSWTNRDAIVLFMNLSG